MENLFDNCNKSRKYFKTFVTKDIKILKKDFKNFNDQEIILIKILNFLMIENFFSLLVKNIYKNFDGYEKILTRQ